MRLLRLVLLAACVACGSDSVASYDRPDASTNDGADGAFDSGLDATAPSDGADGSPADGGPPGDAAAPHDASSDGDDASPADGDGQSGDGDAGEPGPDAGNLPYFERACGQCPSAPEEGAVVETNLCFPASTGDVCAFYCTRYNPGQGTWTSIAGRRDLCARLGGHCVYLDENWAPVPGNQELTDESEYCVPMFEP